MKFRFIAVIFILAGSLRSNAQNSENRYVSLAIFNTQNAKPFGKFEGLFEEVLHPGIEAGYGKNILLKNNHEWFLELKLAYFYHRFVQHGVPFYLNFGYRYKLTDHFSTEASIGGGYMHSIPAVAQLKQNDNGEYVSAKGIGRPQATASFAIGVGYTPNPHSLRPITLFTSYQQRVQMPFVKSYVPLLPYNSFFIGLKTPVNKK